MYIPSSIEKCIHLLNHVNVHFKIKLLYSILFVILWLIMQNNRYLYWDVHFFLAKKHSSDLYIKLAFWFWSFLKNALKYSRRRVPTIDLWVFPRKARQFMKINHCFLIVYPNNNIKNFIYKIVFIFDSTLSN